MNVRQFPTGQYVSPIAIVTNEMLDINHVNADLELIGELSAIYAEHKHAIRDRLCKANEYGTAIAFNEYRQYKANFKSHVLLAFQIYQDINQVHFSITYAFDKIRAMVEQYQSRHLYLV